MNNQTKNLIAEFARRVLQAQKVFEDTMIRNDLGNLSAVPAMYAFATNVHNYVAAQEMFRRDAELLEHYALLNGDTPTAKALKAFISMNHGSSVEIQMKPLPPVYRKQELVQPIGIEELLTANLRSTFDKYVELPTAYRKLEILDGMVPTSFVSQWRNKEAKKFNDLFAVNPRAFENPLERFSTGFHLPDGWYMETTFNLTQQRHGGNEKRWVVSIKIRETNSPINWKVFTQMDVVWDNGKFSATPFYAVGEAASLSMYAQYMRFFNGSSARRAPLDVEPAYWYENRGFLSLAVQVYNELENCIHFGTEDMIPRAALRECISEFMKAHNYYANTPENMPEDFVAQRLVDLFKETGQEYSYVECYNKHNSDYAAVEFSFSRRIGSEIASEGVLSVTFWYYDVQHLTNLTELPLCKTSNYGRSNGSSITLVIDLTHGKRPKLLEHANTLTTLNFLLDSAMALQQRAKNERDADQ